jgi:uncharacterized protein with HEPN domain
MSDIELVLIILKQIDDALTTIKKRTEYIVKVEDFTHSDYGKEKLDGVCMLFMAIGESLKKIDKLTKYALLKKYPAIDWEGIKGFRDIIAHHYFDIDAEQVYWICKHNLEPLSETVKIIIRDL